MHLCLFEDDGVPALRPLVDTRPAYALRLAMRTIAGTARDAFGQPSLVLHARSHVAAKTAQAYDVPVNDLPENQGVLFVNGRYVAEESAALRGIREAPGTNTARCFAKDDTVVAAWMPEVPAALARAIAAGELLTRGHFEGSATEAVPNVSCLARPWSFFDALRSALQRDYDARLGGTTLAPALQDRPGVTVHPSAVAVNPERIYLAPEVTVQPGAVLNASDGPIYIDEQAQVKAQAVVRGPAYVGPRSQVRIGANLEGVALGTWCKVGGEVHDVIVQGFSNKVHDGFLGHAYLGRWCNLGAGTTNSNLRNDYGPVAMYHVAAGQYETTGRQFAGLIMGDHAKTAIGTTLNTGTVIGVSCNLFGAGLHRRYVPAFSWGGPQHGYQSYRLDKALSVAETVMGRRNRSFTETDRALLTRLHERTGAARQDVFT